VEGRIFLLYTRCYYILHVIEYIFTGSSLHTMKRVSILNVPFTYITKQTLIETLQTHVEKREKAFVVTANPEIVMMASRDDSFMKLVHEATYVTADGIGVVKAAQILGSPLPERVTGFDTMMGLLDVANKQQFSIFLLGATEDTLEKTVATIKETYPDIRIAGAEHGFFSDAEAIHKRVREAKPDMTFVALGAPRQEKWIADQMNVAEHGIFIGVGGSFDVLAGTVKRAPKMWQTLNLEWLYRLLKQPSRWKRMLDLPRFGIRVLLVRLRGKSS